MLVCKSITGRESDPEIAEILHDLEHRGQLHLLLLSPEDMMRHRIRAKTDQGLDCAVSLPRDEQLTDGAIVHLDEQLAVVVRAQPMRWVHLRALSVASALELGYVAGNMHWKVHFDGDHVAVAQWGSETEIIGRIEHLLEGGQVVVENGKE